MKKRPKAVVREDPDFPGLLYQLWFGKWMLTAGTSRNHLEELAALMNP